MIIHLGQLARFTVMALDNPRLFDAINACVAIQPRIDPQAGYAALQIPMLVDRLWLDDDTLTRLDFATGGQASVFYMVIRACSLGYWSAQQLTDLLRMGETLNYAEALEFTVGVVKQFNAGLVTPHI